MNSTAPKSPMTARERVLLERAARLAQRQGALSSSATEQVILFEVQGQLAGLKAADCVEVVKIDFLTPVPDATDGLLGLLNIHNNFYCLIDVAPSVMGKSSRTEAAFAFAILLRHEALRIAVACDVVLRVENVSEDQTAEGGSLRLDNRFATLINSQTLLAPYETGHEQI